MKSLVEAHDGSVTVHSAGPGRGSTFVVRLPIAALDESLQPQSRSAAAAADLQERAVPSLAGISVLVVDDDEQSRQVVAAQLNGYGAAVSGSARVTHSTRG